MSTILRVVAVILFIFAALGVSLGGHFELVAAGLACWCLSTLVPEGLTVKRDT